MAAGSRGVKLLAALLVLLTAAVSVPSAEAAERKRCPRGGVTVARNDDARIWRVRPSSEIDRFFGCAFEVGRVFRLDPRGGQVIRDRRTLKLAGTMAGYETMDFSLRPYRVVVRSLRTGRVIHTATANSRGSSDGHTGPASRLLLKRNGSVAWMASADCICEGVDPSVNGWEVHAIARNGRRVVHDSGPGIDPDSLAFDPRRGAISWSNLGETRTARLR